MKIQYSSLLSILLSLSTLAFPDQQEMTPENSESFWHCFQEGYILGFLPIIGQTATLSRSEELSKKFKINANLCIDGLYTGHVAGITSFLGALVVANKYKGKKNMAVVAAAPLGLSVASVLPSSIKEFLLSLTTGFGLGFFPIIGQLGTITGLKESSSQANQLALGTGHVAGLYTYISIIKSLGKEHGACVGALAAVAPTTLAVTCLAILANVYSTQS